MRMGSFVQRPLTLTLSPQAVGQSHMRLVGAASSFSPRGEGGPKGRMRGLADLNAGIFVLLAPPHPPVGTFSPRGEGGRGNALISYGIALPQAGRGDDLVCSALSDRQRLRDDGGRVYPLLPVHTGRRWPPFGKNSGGRMRGGTLLERGRA
ncbi:hypothetical protein CCGE531_04325 [Rhizobium sp. CCGE531]|nr:hypothetical protein CCGE531_04325 [Rhizobium sp. CCGE531]AYG71782.1 hypothetical protein CCGE532_04320 [Rhizobium sp. CCGE532]